MEGLFDTINTVSIVLFCIGMILILIEMFIPGIGIFGGLGFVALVLCIVFQANNLVQGLLLLLIIAAIVFLLALIVARSFKRGFLYRSSLVLKDAEDRSEGYVSSDDYTYLVGKKGVGLTPLRPAGIAEIDGEKVDVVTEGEFLPVGTSIQVIKVNGRRIVVRKIDSEILSGL
jgi:membrane-bound ClpP family serine protease